MAESSSWEQQTQDLIEQIRKEQEHWHRVKAEADAKVAALESEYQILDQALKIFRQRSEAKTNPLAGGTARDDRDARPDKASEGGEPATGRTLRTAAPRDTAKTEDSKPAARPARAVANGARPVEAAQDRPKPQGSQRADIAEKIAAARARLAAKTTEEAEEDEEETTPGKPSKVEVTKESSNYLRGNLVAELTSDTPNVSEASYQLLKFHGMYQQDDRDQRQQLKREGKDKHWMFMIRSKIPGGLLTAEQYLAHEHMATHYADGTLRITTRQDFQFHGVLKHSLKTIIRALNKSGVTTFGGCGDLERNIMCCPAPLADRVRTKVQEYTRQLSDHLLPRTKAYYEIWLNGEKVHTTEETEEVEPIYGKTYLPRKFKTGMAFPGDNCIDVYSQDIGIVPVVENDDLAGFNILIGGGLGMTHGNKATYPRLGSPVAFVTPDQLVKAVESIVTLYRDYGDRTNRKHARLKYVVEERGVAWAKAEMERRLGYRLMWPRPLHWEDAYDHLGWHQQADGRWFLGVYVENGRIRDNGSMRMKTAFRLIAEKFRTGIRLTPQQNILFIDVEEKDKTAIDALLAEHGVPAVADLSNALRYAMACPALPTCGLAMSDAERALPPVVRAIEAELARLGLQDEKLSIRMTGCPNGCARPYIGDIGFVGRTLNAYNIYIGGDFEGTRLNELYAEMVPKDKLVATLVPLLEIYQRQRQPGEGFGDFCHRVGVAQLKEMATQYQPV